MKAELLDQNRRDLMVLKLTLSIVGEKSEASGGLLARRASLAQKIEQLENELENIHQSLD